MPKRSHGQYVMSQSLPDLTTTAVLKDSMSSRLRKAMVYPYIFNDYTFNLHNYSTNAPNCFLTLFHSLLHYSSLDAFSVFLKYLRKLRQEKLKTDVQLLYVCFLLGPALHRIEKLDNNTTDAEVKNTHGSHRQSTLKRPLLVLCRVDAYGEAGDDVDGHEGWMVDAGA